MQIEATNNDKRLRHRASLALWCGGNENLELFQSRWSGADQATKFFGEKLILETLPEVLQKHDPKTPYLPNSPWGDEGEGNCQSENVGDAHYWNVWHAKEPTSNGDWTNYAKSTCRFSSEFGFAAPAGMAAWNSCLAPEDKGVRSLASQFHDKTRKGYETYLKFIAMHFPAPETFDELVYFGQANQAMALTFGIEHWRRQMGHCWGTLYWQLNDCWPTHSWATVDSAGEPKLAYWAVKRSYADLLLSLVRTEKFVEAHLVSDFMHSVSGILRLQLVTFTGEVLSSAEISVESPINSTSGSLLEIPVVNRNDVFVTGELLYSENKKLQFQPTYLLLCEPKELQKREINITKEIAGDLEQLQTGLVGDSNLTIVLSVDQFAAFVYICTPKRPGTKLSNNGFHLAPGQSFLLHVYDLPENMHLDDALDLLEIRYL